ncbi:MAG: hypothetical protein ACPL7D_09910, partial [Candidatus Sumerlaeaceae bacterium]
GAAISVATVFATGQYSPTSPGTEGGNIPEKLRQTIEQRRNRSEAQVTPPGRSSESPQIQQGGPRYRAGDESRNVESTSQWRRNAESGLRSQGQAGSGESPAGSGTPAILRERKRDLRGPNLPTELGQSVGERQQSESKKSQLRERLRSTGPTEGQSGETPESVPQGTANIRGIEKKDIRRGRVESTPASGASQGSLVDEKRQQLRQRLEQLHKQGEQSEKQATDATPSAGTGGRTGRLSAEELRKKLEEKRKGQLGQGEQMQGTPTPSDGQQQGRLSREELKRKLDEQRRAQKDQQQSGQQGTQAGAGQQQGEQGTKQLGERGQRLTRDELRQRLEELRQKKTGQQTPATGEQEKTSALEERRQKLEQLRQKAEEKRKGDLRAQLKPEDREKLRALYEQSKGKSLRELAQQLRSEQDPQKGGVDRKVLAAKLQELRRFQGEERAKLIGANLEERKGQLDSSRVARQQFRAEDIRKRFGDVQAKPRIELAKQDLERLNRGEILPYLRPHGTHGLVYRPLEHEWRYRHERWFCPPPPHRRGYGIDLVGFHWDYWDGRYRYDHHWAINIFINIGHHRYDGFDGVIVGGRYFCYGWGWIDGCIDYGDCRVWVPGFWAPYTVTECCDCEVWVPPVYDWVWTGCCWEQVLVSGGYFVRQPSGCHTVTRWRWVPGHFEYYRC